MPFKKEIEKRARAKSTAKRNQNFASQMSAPAAQPKPETQIPAAKETVKSWGMTTDRGKKAEQDETVLAGAVSDGLSGRTAGYHHGALTALADAVSHHHANTLAAVGPSQGAVGEPVYGNKSDHTTAQRSLTQAYMHLAKHSEHEQRARTLENGSSEQRAARQKAGQSLSNAVAHLNNAAGRIAGKKRGAVTSRYGETISIPDIEKVSHQVLHDYHKVNGNMPVSAPQKATKTEAYRAKGMTEEEIQAKKEAQSKKAAGEAEPGKRYTRPASMNPDEGLSTKERSRQRVESLKRDINLGGRSIDEMPNRNVSISPEEKTYHQNKVYHAKATGKAVPWESMAHLDNKEIDAIHEHVNNSHPDVVKKVANKAADVIGKFEKRQALKSKGLGVSYSPKPPMRGK